MNLLSMMMLHINSYPLISLVLKKKPSPPPSIGIHLPKQMQSLSPTYSFTNMTFFCFVFVITLLLSNHEGPLSPAKPYRIPDSFLKISQSSSSATWAPYIFWALLKLFLQVLWSPFPSASAPLFLHLFVGLLNHVLGSVVSLFMMSWLRFIMERLNGLGREVLVPLGRCSRY